MCLSVSFINNIQHPNHNSFPIWWLEDDPFQLKQLLFVKGTFVRFAVVISPPPSFATPHLPKASFHVSHLLNLGHSQHLRETQNPSRDVLSQHQGCGTPQKMGLQECRELLLEGICTVFFFQLTKVGWKLEVGYWERLQLFVYRICKTKGSEGNTSRTTTMSFCPQNCCCLLAFLFRDKHEIMILINILNTVPSWKLYNISDPKSIGKMCFSFPYLGYGPPIGDIYLFANWTHQLDGLLEKVICQKSFAYNITTKLAEKNKHWRDKHIYSINHITCNMFINIKKYAIIIPRTQMGPHITGRFGAP